MKNRWSLYLIPIALVIILLSQLAKAQEITAIPNGVLQKGLDATVTGNNVRVRKGPSLKYEIITKLNRGDEVIILERNDKIYTIGKMKNYWYRIKIKSSGVTGWIYGAFLRVENKSMQRSIKPGTARVKYHRNTSSPTVSLQNLGEIKDLKNKGLKVLFGDLDGTKGEELILITPGDRTGRFTISGYEFSSGRFTKVYTSWFASKDIINADIIQNKEFNRDLLQISGEKLSQILIFDKKRRGMRVLYRANSRFLDIAKLSPNSNYLIKTRKNPYKDYDGTVTYYIDIIPIKIKRNKISILGREIEYKFPLPVKKLITFDTNNDGKDEIITEIGGKDKGGGIVILGFKDNSINRLVNSGINTYNGNQFIKLWGTFFEGNPRIAVYTTNPGKYSDANTEFGFLFFSQEKNILMYEKFYRVNKMLDEINNNRHIVAIKKSQLAEVALIADYDESKHSLTVKKPLF